MSGEKLIIKTQKEFIIFNQFAIMNYNIDSYIFMIKLCLRIIYLPSPILIFQV